MNVLKGTFSSDCTFNFIRIVLRVAVDVMFPYVRRCGSHDMSSFSHIPKLTAGLCLLTPYIDVGVAIICSMPWIQHRPHLTIQAAEVRHVPELQCKERYVRHAPWMAVYVILNSAIRLTTWSVLCCPLAVPLLAVILLFYYRIHSYTAWLRTINRHWIVYLHLVRFFARSDDLHIQIMADPALWGRAPP